MFRGSPSAVGWPSVSFPRLAEFIHELPASAAPLLAADPACPALRRPVPRRERRAADRCRPPRGDVRRTSRARTGDLPGHAGVQTGSNLHQVLGYSGVALAVAAVLAAALGWPVAERTLRPLRTITQSARVISASNLHERLSLNASYQELAALGETLDDLFRRLEASFESQRRLMANPSHALRTPLTAERTLLQVPLADPDATAETLRSACEERRLCHPRWLVRAPAANAERAVSTLRPLENSGQLSKSWHRRCPSRCRPAPRRPGPP